MSLSCTGLRHCEVLVEIRRFEHIPPLIGAPLGVTPLEFRRDLWRQKTSPRAIVLRCLRDPTFSRFGTIRRVQTDRRTDRRTDT